MKDKTNPDKTFDEGNMYILLFSSRHVIHIPSFCILNLLCCGGHFDNITFTDARTKYRSPVSLLGPPQDVVGT